MKRQRTPMNEERRTPRNKEIKDSKDGDGMN